MSGISNDCCLPTCSTTMRTGLILDWRRQRQQLVQQKFALRVKARFNPFRDWAGCTIAMRWQRRLQGNSSQDKTLLAVTRQRRSSRFLRASFHDPQISLRSQTEELPPSRKKSFSCRTKRFGDPQEASNCLSAANISSPPGKRMTPRGSVRARAREGMGTCRRCTRA
jgi:hypothetical protein